MQLASGGMATLYLAATDGPAGYEKMVALKRIHPHLAKERRFLDMFLDEESQSLAQLSDFITKPISLQVESLFTQEQYDIILL